VAGTYGAETSDCDTPFSLVKATFDWIAANLKDNIDFVIWTGDSARHDNDDQIPRSPAQVLGTNRWVASKFEELFADPSAMGRQLAVPVIPTLGNNDILPHNILLPGPNQWLRRYADIWRRFIPEEQRHAFEFGGWFYVEVIPKKLAVFSLNTLYFFDRNAGVDNCVKPSEPGFKQMEWLRIQLQLMRQRGLKAILMGHVPPARTGSKKNWDETCWQKYTLWLQQYRDVVVGAVYGHMNIDHFILQDTMDIDVSMLSQAAEERVSVREAMEDELSIESSADYLLELRSDWSKLPRPLGIHVDEVELNKGKEKPKQPIGPWAQRYQLSLISPSIVPNYFPTLRVIEYNISGLEDTAVWSDLPAQSPSVSEPLAPSRLELRDLSDSKLEENNKKEKKGKVGMNKRKGDKNKKPKAPKLVIPDPPSESSPPGPAYSPQPFTFTGYTQYFANLTYINNDIKPSEFGDESDVDESKWREGKHRDKKPKHDNPKPREFRFEVEYSTFDDKIYNVSDLTVNNFVHLAYRMSKGTKGHGFGGVIEDETGNPEQREDAMEADFGSEEANEAWLHFLRHAFVSTIEKEELEKRF
jgi:endopolyphosphatase